MGRVANNRQAVGANSYTMLYRYYPGGVLKSEQYPSGRVVSYAYDDAARLSGVTSGATNYGSNYQYGPKGLLTSVTLGNGAIESYDYNERLQLASLSLTKNSNTIQRYDYKYGVAQADGTVDETKNNGQIGRIESFIGTQKQWQQRFSYDSLGRLSQSSEYRGDNSQLSYLINYDYDAFGNRYQHQASNPANTNPLPYVAVEDADINKSTNRFTFSQMTYDDAGNVLSDSKFTGQQYTYDANNRQRQVTTLSTNAKGGPAYPPTISVYDGTGQRVAQMTGSSINQVFVYDAPGKLVAEYGQAPIYQNYIMIETNGGTQYVLTDHQGSTRVVTDAQGLEVARHDYEPFGREIYDVGMRANQGYGAGDGVRQKYAGMEMDEGSGLDHTLWRKYDSSSGRWTSPDPYGGSMSISSPQSFNRYAYVNNDPVNKVDPTGLLLSDIGILQTDNPALARYEEKNATWHTLCSATRSGSQPHGHPEHSSHSHSGGVGETESNHSSSSLTKEHSNTEEGPSEHMGHGSRDDEGASQTKQKITLCKDVIYGLPTEVDSVALMYTLAHEVSPNGGEDEAYLIEGAIWNHAYRLSKRQNDKLQEGDIFRAIVSPGYIIDPINKPGWEPNDYLNYGAELVEHTLSLNLINNKLNQSACRRLQAIINIANNPSRNPAAGDNEHWVGKGDHTVLRP
jgi:RHS repeat-associated protein